MQLVRTLTLVFILLSSLFAPNILTAQHSIARQWNEVLVEAIRKDFARPTIHARNLFHTSVIMYDAWAAYEEGYETFFLGQTIGDFSCPFEGINYRSSKLTDQETAISYATYRLLKHRFKDSPGAAATLAIIEDKFAELKYDPNFVDIDYRNGSAAALGNHLAEQMIAFGLQDGSNEEFSYRNSYYFPQNFPMNPAIPGPGFVFTPNHWQPLSFETFTDQSGNQIPGSALKFLSPEWGNVVPFALAEEDLTTYKRDDFDFLVYHDPGRPPLIDPHKEDENSKLYKWGFNLVSIWSSHLDPTDTTLWDISPNAIGNIPSYPTSFEEYDQFYNLLEGGDPSIGYTSNPITGEPYAKQFVKRSDYARVLAEFWADGPDSETPPGHWFSILNYVNDHPLLEKRFSGEGEILSDLEWDVKSYFILGGAMHDAAISAWGIKGWYDYIRPISAIRYMADKGQSSDPNLPRYSEAGIPLVEGYVELIGLGDELVGPNNVNLNKIKVYAWKGPDFISNPDTDVAGVGWILAEEWWPYQRPDFVTPPFAGYISGHSTFSRAAAEVLTLITGDAFFPGGMGEFIAEKNEFLVFEEGPTEDITLQWATYRDASDQTSLSRIWGGIHPPADDIPGRLIGIEIGNDCFNKAVSYFGVVSSVPHVAGTVGATIYPNPIGKENLLRIELNQPNANLRLEIYNMQGQAVLVRNLNTDILQSSISISTSALENGFYIAKLIGSDWSSSYKLVKDR